jgi:hypothetical protein
VLQAIAHASSAGGNPETRQFIYRGPNINPPGTSNPVTPDVAIRQLFAWFNGNGGPNLPLNGTPTIPGVSPQIGELSSPYTWEYATGVNRQFGSRAAARVDFIYRNYRDFYIDRNAPGLPACSRSTRLRQRPLRASTATWGRISVARSAASLTRRRSSWVAG